MDNQKRPYEQDCDRVVEEIMQKLRTNIMFTEDTDMLMRVAIKGAYLGGVCYAVDFLKKENDKQAAIINSIKSEFNGPIQ